MAWEKETWIDDDGSLTVGTEFDAEHMNNIELGIAEGMGEALAASGMAGSALTRAASGVTAAGSALTTAQDARTVAGSALLTGQNANVLAASGVTAAGSALVTGQQANARAASGVAAAGSALVTGQFAGALAGSALFTGQQANVAAGSALFTGQQANALAASGVFAAGSALTTGQKAGALAASGVGMAGSGVTGVTNLLNLLVTNGVEAVFHMTDPNVKRPSGVSMAVWIGTVEPLNAFANDPWINPEDFGIGVERYVPTCRVYRSTGQSIVTGTVTPITFDSERWDIGNIHSTVTNTARLTAPIAGIYTVSAHVGWEAEITNPTFMAIRVNGATAYAAQWTVASFQTEQSTHTEVKLEAGDYVEVLVYQNQGKNVSTAGAGKSNYAFGVEATMTWMGTGTTTGQPIDWGIVTELPGGAGVGDYCSLKVRESESQPWKLWRCQKLESSGERPWVKIGGAPLYIESNTEKTTSSATPTEESGTKLTVPANLEADIDWGTKLTALQEAKLGAGQLDLYKGSTLIDWVAMAGSQIFDGGPQLGMKRAVVAKGESVNVRYVAEVAGTPVKFIHFYLRLDAVRLG